MSMPHAPPTPPLITPIGYHFMPTAHIAGETNFFLGVAFVVMALVALAILRNSEYNFPLPVLIFVCFLALFVLHLVNKNREIKFITKESHNRNYLGRFAFRVGASTGLLLTSLFALRWYPQSWASMLTVAGLLGLASWNLKSPDRKQPFTGANSASNYWRRITGSASFSQLDYGPGDTVRFTYEDAQTRNGKKQYNVFLNRIQEFRSRPANRGQFTWEREVLWSSHKQVSPGQLSRGLSFGVTEVSKKTISPKYYGLLYWEVVLQEVDGSFQERFLLGVDKFRKAGTERLKALKA